MIAELLAELKQTQDAISDAIEKEASIGGGLVKVLVTSRLEILKTTHALLQQRIVAIEAGASLTIEIPATKPDPEFAIRIAQEIEAQQVIIDAARSDVARFTGGLVHGLKLSTLATQEQTLAMLRQRYLIGKYGLAFPQAAVSALASVSATTTTSPVTEVTNGPGLDAILKVRLLKKQFATQNMQNYIFFDIEYSAQGLKRPARAIKGILNLNDLFGATKMSIEFTLGRPPDPGGVVTEKGTGFKYNQFMAPHQWANATGLDNMTASFSVTSILYQDGSRDDLP